MRAAPLASLLLAAALVSPAGAQADQTLTSGQLEAKQSEKLVCTLVNKGALDVEATLSLETPGGALLGPSATPTIGPGQSDSLTYTVPFGPVVSAYCHVLVPADATVFGNLRVNDPLMATRTSSQLRGDVHAGLGGILGELEALGPSGFRSAGGPPPGGGGTRARCGLGFELALALSGLLAGRRRRRS